MVCSILAFVLNTIVFPQPLPNVEVLDPKFKERAFNHVQNLSNIGIRAAGSEIEAKATNYIKKQFENAGCKVEVESFEFNCFVLEKAVVQLGDYKFEPTLLGFNPYDNVRKINGEVAFVDPATPREQFLTLELEGKIVVTTKPANFYQVTIKKPKSIVFIDSTRFQDLKKQDIGIIDISVIGKVKKLKSANVVAYLTPKSSATKEIILSAHLDSYNGPGADDNASGIGVLVELTKHFNRFKDKIPCKLKFVAFGAEELGMMGSQAFLERHQQELENCILLFNMDSVGSSGEIYVEGRGGIRNVPPIKGKSQYPDQIKLKANHDFNDKWQLLHPAILIPFMTSNVPDWLREIIITTGEDLGYKINLARDMGSDHRIFVQAGLVTTNIAIAGNSKNHTPEDTPDKVNLDSLQKAGEIVASVVTKTMERF